MSMRVALLQLAEQRAVGLAQLVAGSLEGFHFLQACAVLGILLDDLIPVSYTHLDVYKRQQRMPSGSFYERSFS